MSDQQKPTNVDQEKIDQLLEYVENERQQDIDLGMDVRMKVIKTALRVEMLATHVLGAILGIDANKSCVIGSKGSPLTFKQKVLLMVEVAALDKDDIAMFDMFMEIRNTFAHDIRAVSIEACFDLLDQRDKDKNTRKYVLKLVDNPYWTKIEQEMTELDKLDVGVSLLGMMVYGRSMFALKIAKERVDDKLKAVLGAEAYQIFKEEHSKPFIDLIARLSMVKGQLILTDAILEEIKKLSDGQWELMAKTWERVDKEKIAQFIAPQYERLVNAPKGGPLKAPPSTPTKKK